jgi:ribose-phosphate pyrophosphokinase
MRNTCAGWSSASVSPENHELAVYSMPDSRGWGRATAAARGVPFSPVRVHVFPDRETLVRVSPPAAPHAVLVQQLHDPNSKLFPTLLAADALRRSGAQRVTLVAPYLPYMRQDAVFRPGECLSQKVFGRLLRLGFDRVLTLEAHLHRVRSLRAVVPGESLSAAPAIAQWLGRHAPRACIAGPDGESARWVQAVARLSGLPDLVGEKERTGDRRVRVRFSAPLPARHVVLVDDIASSGATLAVAARSLYRLGAERVDAVVVHAIFAPGAEELLRRAGVRRVVSCDTVPHPTNRIPCAPLVAAAL